MNNEANTRSVYSGAGHSVQPGRKAAQYPEEIGCFIRKVDKELVFDGQSFEAEDTGGKCGG